ncbi:MAG TPA: hypothetical protein VF102_00325 [Gemmatimonadaceae bacterium]|jgi:prepilin signal peptidase PulO-like enzyme (type II secretory pathway)
MTTADKKGFVYIAAYPVAIAMLVFWAVMTFALSGPGWGHLFLSLGLFILIWRIVAGGTWDAWQRYTAKRNAEERKKS